MRLWAEQLIAVLPRQQILGQHREACSLRGNGWGRKHSTVNYVFKYNLIKLRKWKNGKQEYQIIILML